MSQSIFSNVQIERATDGGGLVALASVDVVGEVRLNGIRVVERDGRTFMSYPGKRLSGPQAGAQAKYKDIFHTLSDGRKSELKGLVLKAYQQLQAAPAAGVA